MSLSIIRRGSRLSIEGILPAQRAQHEEFQIGVPTP